MKNNNEDALTLYKKLVVNLGCAEDLSIKDCMKSRVTAVSVVSISISASKGKPRLINCFTSGGKTQLYVVAKLGKINSKRMNLNNAVCNFSK